MLDVRRMRVLREVAAQGSFSGAAEALNFTQSAVSQHVAALERETGAQLVERGARGVRLTDAGRLLVRHADAILARIESAEDELAALAGLRGGRLRLISFQSGGATLAPRAVASFRGRHPQVELSMSEAEPGEAAQRLSAGEADIALVYDHPALPDLLPDDLDLVHLLDDRYEAILPADHRLAGRRRLSLGDLRDEPWVASTYASGCRQISDVVCREVGFQPKVAFEVDETTAAQALVAAGVGVSIFPHLALTTRHPGVVVRTLSDAPERRIWAARRKDAYASPAADAMLQILQDVAAEFGGAAPLELVADVRA
jgi:DNA-binding transcriptional LysR family regulator